MRLQQTRFHSCRVLHHFLWLSITLHHIPWLSIMLPWLSSLYFSHPAPLLCHTPLMHTHGPTSPRSSLHVCCSQVPGGLVRFPGHLLMLCSRSRSGWWLPLLHVSTSSPNLPLCWACPLRGPVPPCPSLQHFSALQTQFNIVSHGEPWLDVGLINFLVGPRLIAMETCRNCIGSAIVLLGQAGAVRQL